MKNKSRICACISGSILLAMLITGIAAAEEYDFEFNTNDFAVTGYIGNGGNVVIPDVIQECPVEIISSSTFYANDAVESLLFPETLITLEGSNLYMMESLNSVTLPESLVIIDSYNFYGCQNITEITIPERVSYIGDYSFNDCANLKEIRFNGELPVISSSCFEYLAEDVTVYVPEDQLEAYTEALPEGMNIQSTGESAVVCDFTASEEEFEFDAETGTVLSYYGFGARVDIPASIGGVPVTAIGANAFYGHSYLYYVTIPEGVSDIGDNAFESTYHLSWVDFPSTLKNIGRSAFGSYRGYSVEFPEGLEQIGEEAFSYAALYNGIYLPEGLKTIGNRAFCNSGASEVYFPATIESIGDEAFADTYVNYLCFEGKELPHISESAFNGLDITDVDISWQASKEQMESAQAFCDGLGMTARVWRLQNPNVDYIEDGLDVYENGVMIGYTGTQSHLRPWDSFEEYDVTAIGEGALKGNQNLVYFSVPYNDLFTTIGKEALADSSVQTVDLFDSVTTIEEGAFRNCTELKDLVLPNSVTSIGTGALSGCTSLTELVLPESITEIGEEVFAGCTGLTRLVLPADSGYMNAAAFAGVDFSILRISDGATDEQVAAWNELLDTAWYDPVERESEFKTVSVMPYEETVPEDFWYDSEFMRLDDYEGYELNLYLPRSIDGVSVDMISANVLSRAKNTWEEPTLPVKSVVIPETAKELVAEAFCDCQDLEAVICYAPLENVPYRAFANCPSLRQVIFVNGVRNIEELAFENCPNLETVYLGYTDTIVNETAFDSGFDGFAAELPDLDAILETVKAEPLPVPETEVKVETPLPELDAEEAADYLGMWTGVSMGMDGTEVMLDELGMTVELSLNADGTAVMDIAGDIGAMNWCVTEETAYVGTCLEDASAVEIRDDGMLTLDDGDMLMTLKRGEATGEMTAASAVTDEAENSEETGMAVNEAADTDSEDAPVNSAERLDKEYVCSYAMVSGSKIDASMLGAEYAVTFCTDGALKFIMAGTDVPGLKWTEETVQTENGEADAYVVTYFDGSKLNFVFTENGFELDFFGSMLMYFE